MHQASAFFLKNLIRYSSFRWSHDEKGAVKGGKRERKGGEGGGRGRNIGRALNFVLLLYVASRGRGGERSPKKGGGKRGGRGEGDRRWLALIPSLLTTKPRAGKRSQGRRGKGGGKEGAPSAARWNETSLSSSLVAGL